MFSKIIKKIFGSRNDRLLEKYKKIQKKINNLEEIYARSTDQEIKEKYLLLKNNNNNEKIEELLINTYAITREIAKRTIKLRHFDVQILGGIALYDEKITEISTGEGKTLVATLPACLNSLLNKKTHIVTVNDYLVRRDANWMYPIYNFLNISVGTITSNMSLEEKKKAYQADVIYATSSELGFDYLRDNIIKNKNDKVQNELFYVIMDEVDSILIDEARTPLIISTPDKINKNLYIKINNIIKNLHPSKNNNIIGDFIIDEENKQINITETGFLKLETILKKENIILNSINLYETNNTELLHVIYASLKAHNLFKKDIDYIIKDNEILIIDENTGRIMNGRRWGDGIHQAIEAKESLEIKNENQVLATITFQNYFRLYKKKSGMTGTAITEAIEFENIYGLEVIVIPQNKICIRKDYPDIIFLNKHNKFKAILTDIKENNKLGRPLLIGTSSIETSEYISNLLKKNNIKHNVLNAKYHEKESTIIAEAGTFKNVTIATNMAGRGTDIILGGKKKQDTNKILELEGLKIIGVERHESRRIDNQLRGRAGRQGDPGASQFYLSLEDDLIRIFMGDKSIALLEKIKISENDIISHPLINKIIENAQKKIENHNFEIRKQLLEYDDIINEQRIVFYNYRNLIIFCDDINLILIDLITDIINNLYDIYISKEKKNINIFINEIEKKFNLQIIEKINITTLLNAKNKIIDILYNIYIEKLNTQNKIEIKIIAKSILLNILDMKWKEHLINLDLIKSGIHLRGYAQKDPKLEYKNESFYLFNDMLLDSKTEFLICIFKIIENKNQEDNLFQNTKTVEIKNKLIYNQEKTKNETFIRKKNKLGRNELCYCNSGKKYKYCHEKIKEKYV